MTSYASELGISQLVKSMSLIKLPYEICVGRGDLALSVN